MTLLVVAQAIVWALAAWPNTRTLVLSAALFGFLGAPARRDIFESPFVLPPLFLAGRDACSRWLAQNAAWPMDDMGPGNGRSEL